MKNTEKKWEPLFTLTKKDFEMQTFRSGGKGGQHQNKIESGVRLIHRASGAVGESRSDKSQHRNKGLALQRLAVSGKFKAWVNRIAYEITSGKTIEQRVEEAIQPKNLRVEIQDENGNWKEEKL